MGGLSEGLDVNYETLGDPEFLKTKALLIIAFAHPRRVVRCENICQTTRIYISTVKEVRIGFVLKKDCPDTVLREMILLRSFQYLLSSHTMMT